MAAARLEQTCAHLSSGFSGRNHGLPQGTSPIPLFRRSSDEREDALTCPVGDAGATVTDIHGARRSIARHCSDLYLGPGGGSALPPICALFRPLA